MKHFYTVFDSSDQDDQIPYGSHTDFNLIRIAPAEDNAVFTMAKWEPMVQIDVPWA